MSFQLIHFLLFRHFCFLGNGQNFPKREEVFPPKTQPRLSTSDVCLEGEVGRRGVGRRGRTHKRYQKRAIISSIKLKDWTSLRRTFVFTTSQATKQASSPALPKKTSLGSSVYLQLGRPPSTSDAAKGGKLKLNLFENPPEDGVA